MNDVGLELPCQQQPLAGLRLNRLHPLARGVIGVWPCIERAGMQLNDLAAGNSIRMTGTKWQSQNNGWTVPHFPAGSSGQMSRILRPSQWSVVIWFRPTASSGIIVAGLYWSGSYLSTCFWSSNYNENLMGSLSCLVANQWHCITCTLAASSTIAVWVNGVRWWLNYGADIVQVPSQIGSLGGHLGPYWAYDRILTPREIIRHHREPFCALQSNPVGTE